MDGTWFVGPFSHLMQCGYGRSLQFLTCLYMNCFSEESSPVCLPGFLGRRSWPTQISIEAVLLSPMSPIGDHFLSLSGFQGHVIFFK